MLANRGYAAYANNKVMTASPAELTLMLYEEQLSLQILRLRRSRQKIFRKRMIIS